MLSNSKKSKIVDILLEQASHDELLAAFQVIKVLLWKYGKKIYTPALQNTISSQDVLLSSVITVLAMHDQTTSVLDYIALVTAKSNRHSVDLDEDNQSLLYRQGDALYKRSLGRDLEKLLAKK
jgi:hypothetical protein